MEIVLSLLRTLLFVVATVAATVYISRRIGRGRSLLWAGTTLLALYWLVLFGWTAYLAGSSAPNPDLAVWVGWTGHLLPFLAALSYIWGIGQAAGFPSRAGSDSGAKPGRHSDEPAPVAPVAPTSGAGSSGAGSTGAPEPGAGVSGAGTSGATSSTADTAGPTATLPAATPSPGAAGSGAPDKAAAAQPAAKAKPRMPFAGPHAVPVVTTPSASSHHSPTDPPKAKGTK
ncbi:MAG: hypothetical protein IPL41_13550 [Micropruina sp.]|nr:hypothetical protein [Micropruina sp.]